jgi:putative membrane protein
MMTGHQHAASLPQVFLLGLVAAALWVYLAAVRRARQRGRPWPRTRSLLWAGGLAAVAPALVGPIADGSHLDFRAHMLGHLLLGMLGPLLLVLAAPVTLALRALPAHSARRLSANLRRPVVAALTHPAAAAVLNVGGLWVLYRTGLYAASTGSPVLHVAVHLHVFLAGCLLVVAVAGPDPAPHRPGLPVRAAVLVLAVAAHNILAKTIYAFPPAGVDPAQAAAAAQLMYYGAVPVELVMMIVLCREWTRQHDRRRTGGGRPAVPTGRP